MIEVFVVIAIIGVALNSIALGMKIRSDKKNNKITGNPHYCVHEGDWGEVKADIKNIKEDIKEIFRRLNK